MSFLKPTVAEPKSVADYSKTDLELDADAIHELDQLNFIGAILKCYIPKLSVKL